jgi:hypothetical protein
MRYAVPGEGATNVKIQLFNSSISSLALWMPDLLTSVAVGPWYGSGAETA